MARSLALVVCATLFGLDVSADAGDDPVRAELQVRYASLKAAMAAHDPVALRAVLVPGFTSVDVSGHVTGVEEAVGELAAVKPDPNKVSQTTLQSVDVHGDTAVVVQRYDMTSQKPGADGAVHHVHLVTLSTDTWTHADRSWRLVESRTDQLDYEVEGQAPIHRSRATP